MTVLVEVALGDPDPRVSSATYDWSDWTAYVELDDQGVYVRRGYADGSDDPSASEIRFRGKNADLRWHVEHASNPYLGLIHERTPIRISRTFGATTVRAVALLAEVTIIEDVAGGYLAADIVAYGPLYWEESQSGAQSALYGQLVDQADNGLVAYWPGEDPSGSTSLRSVVPTQPPVTSLYLIDTASDSDVVGSKPLWTFADDASWVRAVLAPYARPHPEAWSVVTAWRVPEEPAGTQPFFAVYTDTGTVRRWLLRIIAGTPALLEVRGEDASGTDLLTGTRTMPLIDDDGAEPWGTLVRITLSATQNGADVDWTISSSWGAAGQNGTVATHTLGPVNVLASGPDPGINGWASGHWQVWTDPDAPAGINYEGFRGTDTWVAWFSAAVDAGLPLGGPLTGVTTSTTGVLAIAGPAERLKLLTRSEGGLMYEDTAGGVAIALREDLYAAAATPALTIDRTDGQIRTLLAIRDSFRRANRITVTNQGGGGVVGDAPAPYDPVTAGYVLDRPLTVNLESDAQALRAAQWEAALLSHPDLRYRIGLELTGPASGLRATYLADVDIGSRILITDNPTHSSLDDIDQQVMGIEEWHSQFAFSAILFTRPVALWRDAFIAQTGAGNLSRADTSGSALLAGVDDNDVALLVGTRGNPGGTSGKWSTTAVPYDLALRIRDRVTCTAVTNRTPAFVNAGTAAHADYAAITPGAAAGLAAGDCELLLCSVRDAGGFAAVGGVAGRRARLIGDQLGWTTLARFGGANGSFALYARPWVNAVDTAPPLLTPYNGAAGDTVSAQMCAFRYVQAVTHTVAIPLSNASATNIAYPGLGIIRPACVAILMVQRDDDWTSAATPAGWTEIGEPDSALGTGGQGIAWYYQIQTTATNTAAGSLVVTGGTGTSKATVVSLISDVQTLTVTRGVNSAITAHPMGADVRLWQAGRSVR